MSMFSCILFKRKRVAFSLTLLTLLMSHGYFFFWVSFFYSTKGALWQRRVGYRGRSITSRGLSLGASMSKEERKSNNTRCAVCGVLCAVCCVLYDV